MSLKQRWPKQGLHFPERSAAGWGHVTSLHLGNVKGDDVCHFWAKVIKR